MEEVEISTADGSSGKRHKQARGRLRQKALLQAARKLLFEYGMDQLTLPIVAEHADIPASSAYHFYPDMKELYKDLCREIAAEMISSPTGDLAPENWEGVVTAFIKAGVEFYNKDMASRQLMLGPQTAPDIKRAGCAPEAGFGDALMNLIAKYFVLPDLENPSAVFFRAIQVADTMFMISVEYHNHITEEYMIEARNVMVAYLGLYLPKVLRKNQD